MERRNYRMERQFWSDLPLDRHPLPELHDDELSHQETTKVVKDAFDHPESRFLLFRDGKIALANQIKDIDSKGETSASESSGKSLAWWTWAQVSALPSWRARELEPEPEKFVGEMDGDSAGRTVILLGRKKKVGDVEHDNCGESHDEVILGSGWRFVCDVSGVEDPALEKLTFIHPRSMLNKLPSGDMAVVGQAVSRMNWHLEMAHSPRTGAATAPIGCGHRRRDWSQEDRRNAVFYPRTDPVAIMLVQSKDGERCLLGKTRRRGGGNMYSCLAGFVEQAESVEAACRREVFEESGVLVGDEVQIVGTQPWPIGAAGHCELMVGCIARASCEDINMDEKEMADVRWFTRAEALELLRLSHVPGAMGNPEYKAVVPPDWAIAHHLIKSWAENDVWDTAPVSPSKDPSWLMVAASSLAVGMIAGVFIGRL